MAQKRGPRAWRRWAPVLSGKSCSGGEAAAAPAATRRVGVAEGEARALHGADVVDGDAREILGAEAVDEDADAVQLVDQVVVERALLDVQAVLEARAATRQDAHAEPRRLGRHLLLGDELLHLFSRPFGQGHLKPGGRGLLVDAHAWLLPSIGCWTSFSWVET